ncbi:MAG: hypothetical protein QOJ62_1675, partial [Actinomycetota bacterium]|nr:hypothetical protein [Actinomycetota bacterium]
MAAHTGPSSGSDAVNEGDDDLERRLRDVLHDRGLSITPGHDALDRVHAGARRRQQRRVVASGSVAVALVAVVGSALALRPHNPRPVVADNQHALTSSSPATTPPSALLSAPASEVASSAPAVAPSISASDSPNAPSVFNPVSVTAVSADAFWVLGYTTTTSTDGYGIATSIRRTTDGGQHFTTVGAPDMLVAQAPMSRPPGAPTVSDIRFGDPNDGWAYGRALYATADGGTSWSQVTEIAGGVVDLVAANGVAWAVVDLSSGSPSPAGRTHYALYSTGYGHGQQQWKPVQLPIELGDTQPSIVDQDGTVTVLASGPLRTGYVGHALVASPGGPFIDHTGPCLQDMGGHLSNSKNAIWAVCPTGHAAGLQISTDRGATWTPYTQS